MVSVLSGENVVSVYKYLEYGNRVGFLPLSRRVRRNKVAKMKSKSVVPSRRHEFVLDLFQLWSTSFILARTTTPRLCSSSLERVYHGIPHLSVLCMRVCLSGVMEQCMAIMKELGMRHARILSTTNHKASYYMPLSIK